VRRLLLCSPVPHHVYRKSRRIERRRENVERQELGVGLSHAARQGRDQIGARDDQRSHQEMRCAKHHAPTEPLVGEQGVYDVPRKVACSDQDVPNLHIVLQGESRLDLRVPFASDAGDGKQYVVGESMTLADLRLASSLMYAKQAQVPLAEFPNIQAWFSRISGMDAWKKTDL
jgi:hypothetical protein